MALLYHERQEAALCGVHCLNTLLQGPFFTEWDLASAAHELDALEHELMASQGVETKDFMKFAAEDSGNVAKDGMFSIQVLQKALSSWDVQVTPLAHPAKRTFLHSPTLASGYICNLEQHWFAVRPVLERWWNFNSVVPAPQPVGTTYLDAFLNTLQLQNWTIYVVEGALPLQADPSMVTGNGTGKLWTVEEAKQANLGSDKAKAQGKRKAVWEDVMQLAGRRGGAVSLSSTRNGSVQAHGGDPLTEEQQVLAAMQASLAVTKDAGDVAEGDDDDARLAAAIAASLGDGRPECPLSGIREECVPAQPPCNSANEKSLGEREETSGVSGDCEVCVRLPSGQRCTGRFNRAEPLRRVTRWMADMGWDMQTHRICSACPRRVLADDALTLEQCGLTTAREVLVLETAPR